MSVIDYKIDPVVEYWLVRTLNFFICFVNFWTDLFLGWNFTFGSKAERRAAQEDYTKSAHIVDILYRGDYGVINTRRLRNFFFRHNRYTDPKVILENDSVTFFGFTRNHAFFCVSNNVDVTDSKIISFMHLSMFLNAQQLIIMPIKHFHRLASEVPEPKEKVAHIHMTARCGSTLLAQIFRMVPGVRVLSEPWCYTDIQFRWFRRDWTQEETDQATISATKLLLKPRLKDPPNYSIIKHTPFTNQQFPVMFKAFPNRKWIFNTRLLKSAMHSFCKTAGSSPNYYLSGPFFTEFYFRCCSFPRDEPEWRQLIDDVLKNPDKYTFAEKLSLGGISFYANYLRDKKHYDVCTFYKDIHGNSKEELTRIFKAIDLDPSLVDEGMKALKFDSQKEVLGKRGHEGVVITDKEFERIDKWYAQFGLPVSYKQTLDEMKKEFALE